MMRILILVAVLAFAFPLPSMADSSGKSFTDAPSPPPPPPAPLEAPRTDKPMEDYTKNFARKDFTVDAAPRHAMAYWWRQPDKIDTGVTYPLVIVLHDEKGTATAAEYLLAKAVHDAYPSFIAVPVLAIKKIWAFPSEYPDDPALETVKSKLVQAMPDVYSLIQDIKSNFPVDDKRIYVVGCGDGGFGAYGAVYNDPTNMFAAAIAINGGWTQKQTFKLAKSKTAFYILHGNDDKVYSPTLDSYVAFDIQKMKGNVHYLPVPGLGHECNDPRLYSSLLWKWMYSQHRQ